MNDDAWRVVETAFREYAVPIFPDQNMSEGGQTGFARRFGKIKLLRDDPDAKVVTIGNRKDGGGTRGPDEFRYKILRGNEGWHTDSSCMPLAAKAAVLSAQTVPL